MLKVVVPGILLAVGVHAASQHQQSVASSPSEMSEAPAPVVRRSPVQPSQTIPPLHVVSDGVYRVGGAVSAPQVVSKVEPEYTEEARKAGLNGTVVLYVVVDEKGQPSDLRVIHPLGLGLDQEAIKAVTKWRFRPGRKDGHPVAVSAQIKINFRLL